MSLLVFAFLAAPLAFATPTLTETARLPTANVFPALAPGLTSFYVLGGIGPQGGPQSLLDGIVEVNLATGIVTNVSKLPTALALAAYATVDGITFTFGGVVPNTTSSAKATDQIGRFDPATERFTLMNARLPRPEYAGTAVWGDDSFYVFGSFNQESGAAQGIIRYDPYIDRVEEIPLPSDVSFVASPIARLGGWIYVYGGVYGGEFTTEIFRFSVTNRAIERLNETLPHLVALSSAQRIGDDVYLFGPTQFRGAPEGAIIRHSPATGEIQTLPIMLPDGMSYPRTTTMNGRAILAGGMNRTQNFDTIFEFDADYAGFASLSHLVRSESIIPGDTSVEGAPQEDDPRTYDVSAVLLGTRLPTLNVFTNGLLTEPVNVRPFDHDVAVGVDAGARTDPDTRVCLVGAKGSCIAWLPADPSDPEPALEGGRGHVDVDLYVDGTRLSHRIEVPLVGNALP